MGNDISNLLGRFGANANGYLEVENEVEYKEPPKKPVVKPAPVIAKSPVNEVKEAPPVPEKKPATPALNVAPVATKAVAKERVEPVIEDLPDVAAAPAAATPAPTPVTPAAVIAPASSSPVVLTAKAAATSRPAERSLSTPASISAVSTSLRTMLNEVALKREAMSRAHDEATPPALNAVLPTTPAQVIAVVSPKGGVGKTTIAAALAGALNRKGRAIAIDLDPQNALQYHLGVSAHAEQRSDAGWNALLLDGVAGTRVLPFSAIPDDERRALAYGAEQDPHWLARQLAGMNLHADDVVILDTPAGRTPSLAQALDVADQVVLVVTPDAASFLTLDHIEQLLEGRADCSYIVNQFDASRTFSQDMLEVLKRRIGTKLIGVVSYDNAINEGLAYGANPLMEEGQSPAWQDMQAIGDVLKADAHASALAGGRAS